MKNLYPMAFGIGLVVSLLWKVLRRKRLGPAKTEPPDDYGTPVAPTG